LGPPADAALLRRASVFEAADIREWRGHDVALSAKLS
jgi:hypothetical protein